MKKDKTFDSDTMKEDSEEDSFTGYRVLSIDEVFVLAGGFEKYQIYASIAGMSSLAVALFFCVMFPHLMSFPEILGCIGGEGGRCPNTEAACEMGKYAIQRPYYNLVSEYNLVCSPDWVRPLYFMGVAVGACTWGIFGDLFGRLAMMFVGNTGALITIISFSLNSNFYLMLCFSFLAGIFTLPLLPSAISFIVESTQERHSPVLIMVGLALFSFERVLFSFFWYFKFDYRASLYSVLTFIFIFYFLFFQLYKTPRFLLHTCRMSEAISNLYKIAETNSRLLPEKLILASEDQQSIERLKSWKAVLSYICSFCKRSQLLFGITGIALGYAFVQSSCEFRFSVFELITQAGLLLVTYLLHQYMKSRLTLMIMLGAATGLLYLKSWEVMSFPEPLLFFTLTGVAYAALMWLNEVVPVAVKNSCISLSIACGVCGGLLGFFMGNSWIMKGYFGISIFGTAFFLSLLLPPEVISEDYKGI